MKEKCFVLRLNMNLFNYIIVLCSFEIIICLQIETTQDPEITSEALNKITLYTELPNKDDFERCKQQNCRRKCCPKDYIFNVRTNMCSAIEEYPFDVQEWNVRDDWQNSSDLVTGFPPNPINETVNKTRFCGFHKEEDYEIQQNGQLLLFVRKQTYSSDFYCIENYVNRENRTKQLAQVCIYIIHLSQFETATRNTQQISHSISLVSLVVILILYAFDPVKNNLQTKCIISYCVTLFISILINTLLMSETITNTLDGKQNTCVFLGLSLQYFGLSYICWLNLSVYEIFRIVRGTMKIRPLQQLQGSNKRFYVYALVAFGFPLIVSIVTVTFQYIPDAAISSSVRDYIIRPEIGDGRCWFKEENGSIYAYYYGIEAAVIIVDSVFLICTAVILKIGVHSQFQMKNHNKKNYLELFWQQFYTIIMHIFVWIMNCMSLIYPRMEFWGVVNVIVALQGFFLLLIVIRSRNYVLVKKALTSSKSWFSSFSTSSGTESFNLRSSTSKIVDQSP